MGGLGRKVFTRETLGSADVNGYLMDQVVMRFASAAARDAEIPAPTEGMVATHDDGDTIVRWLPVRGWTKVAGVRGVALANPNLGTSPTQGVGGTMTAYSGTITLGAGGATDVGHIRFTVGLSATASTICVVRLLVNGAVVDEQLANVVGTERAPLTLGGPVSLNAGANSYVLEIQNQAGGNITGSYAGLRVWA